MIDRIKEIVKKEFNIDVLEVVETVDKVYFRLPDDLTRGQVEAIVTAISREVPCKRARGDC